MAFTVANVEEKATATCSACTTSCSGKPLAAALLNNTHAHRAESCLVLISAANLPGLISYAVLSSVTLSQDALAGGI
jgi:hypothetical protein